VESRVLVIDAQMAGIAGDMFVAALIDLGADAKAVVAAMEAAARYVPNVKSLRVTPKPVERSHIGGLYLDVQIDESYKTRSGSVLIEAVQAMTKDLKLSSGASIYAHRAIEILIHAEAAVHRHTPESVHLHAAGSVDTVADIIGAATALDTLQLANPKDTSYYSLPIAVGGGTFPSSHGRLAAPGPAVTRICEEAGLLFRGGPLEQELATPTGVSLVAALIPESTPIYPGLRPIGVGYGAGTADLKNVPNLLKMVKAEPLTPRRLLQDRVLVLETNVDDVTGETLGFVIQQLMAAGAKDVTVLPTVTKKNRPGHLISVIASPEDEVRLTHLLIKETGSLGVRVTSCDRHLLARKIVSVKIRLGDAEQEIRVKVAMDRTGAILQVKAEYDDIQQAARSTGKPMIEIARVAEAAARQQLAEKEGKGARRRSKRA
jgi:uncharacterized protein (TIGR00299 family) protein